MFGRNKILKPDRGDGRQLWVKEIFGTIQGEGPLAGSPAIFVRLAGCNLRCYFCDTDFDNGDLRDIDSIVDEVFFHGDAVKTDLVVITGGEPLRQNIRRLVNELFLEGFNVQIETSGTLWVDGIRDLCTFVVSPKTGKINKNFDLLDYYKYVVAEGECSEQDGLPIVSTQFEHKELLIARPPEGTPPGNIFIQPKDVQNGIRNLRNAKYAAKICMRFGYNLSLQMHKIVKLP